MDRTVVCAPSPFPHAHFVAVLKAMHLKDTQPFCHLSKVSRGIEVDFLDTHRALCA